jgi:hypothetical protein
VVEHHHDRVLCSAQLIELVVITPTEFVPKTAPVDALVSSDAFAVVSEPTPSSLSIAALAADIKGVNIQKLKTFKVCLVRLTFALRQAVG